MLKTTQARREALTVFLLFVGYAGYYACRSNLSVCKPQILEEFAKQGITTEAMGLITSVGTLLYALGKFIFGTSSNKLKGRTLFLSGMIGAIVFTVLFALLGPVAFLICWSGNRFIQATGWVGMVKITGQWFDFRRYGSVMGIISLSYLIGDAVSRVILGHLVNLGWDWRSIFYAAAGCLTVFLIGNLVLLKETPEEVGLAPVPVDPESKMSGLEVTASDTLKAIFSQQSFWIVCILSFGFTLMRETFNDWTPVYLNKVAGLSKGDAGMASSLFPLFGGLSVVLVGWLSDRFSTGGRALIIVGGLLLGVVGLGLLGFLPAGASQVLYVGLIAILAFVLIGPYSLLAGAISLDLGGRKAGGVAAGWIDGVGYIGGILSGYGVAAIAEKYGWGTAWWVLAGVSFLSAIAAFEYWNSDRRSRLKQAN